MGRRGTFGVRHAVKRAAVGVVCLATAISLAATNDSPAKSADKGVSVISVRSGDYVNLVVENRRIHDITLALQITARNVTVFRVTPETATYAARSRTTAARLSMSDPAKTWRLHYHFDWVKGDMAAKHDDQSVYRLPYKRGTSHRVAQGYNGPMSHQGGDQYAIDFAMSEGTVVCAARDGLVVDLEKSYQDGAADDQHIGQSNFVSILHEDGTMAEYLHLQHNGVLVEVGQHVTAGTPIAYSGNTGYSTRPHLHFGVYSAVDGTHVQSHPVTFATRQGTVAEPIVGRLYTAD